MPFLRIPEDTIREACQALYDRQQNAGSWKNGVPESFRKIKEIYGFQDHELWVLTVEGIVKDAAIELVVRGTIG